MNDIKVPIENPTLCFDAGYSMAMLDLAAMIQSGAQMDQIKETLAAVGKNRTAKLLKDAGDMLVQHGYKAGEYEIGVNRDENDPLPQFVLIPIIEKGPELILPEPKPERLVDVNGETLQ